MLSSLPGGWFCGGLTPFSQRFVEGHLLAARTSSGNPRRISFAKITEPLEVPQLLSLQTDSFDWLVGNEAWQAVSAELYKAASEKARADKGAEAQTGERGAQPGAEEGKKEEGPIIDAEVVDEKK